MGRSIAVGRVGEATAAFRLEKGWRGFAVLWRYRKRARELRRRQPRPRDVQADVGVRSAPAAANREPPRLGDPLTEREADGTLVRGEKSFASGRGTRADTSASSPPIAIRHVRKFTTHRHPPRLAD